MRTWNEKVPFMQSLKENNELIQHFSEEELLSLFDFKEIFKSVDYIYSKLNI